MLKSNLYDYRDLYILVRLNIEVKEAEADAAGRNADKRDKQATFKKMHSIY